MTYMYVQPVYTECCWVEIARPTARVRFSGAGLGCNREHEGWLTWHSVRSCGRMIVANMWRSAVPLIVVCVVTASIIRCKKLSKRLYYKWSEVTRCQSISDSTKQNITRGVIGAQIWIKLHFFLLLVCCESHSCSFIIMFRLVKLGSIQWIE